MTKQLYNLYLSVIAFIIITSLIMLIIYIELPTGLVEVAMIFIGMASITSLALIHRFVETQSSPLIYINFDASRSQQILDYLLPKSTDAHMSKDNLDADYEPWEPRALDLLVEDPTLALAKLRIDIERELRKLAFREDIAASTRVLGVRKLVEELMQRQILQPEIVAAIDDVLPALNKAVHGAEILPSTAASVLKVGEQILRYLRHFSTTQNGQS